MDVFVARQPILDRERKLYAYELLFRSGPENLFTFGDADQASSRVIQDALGVFGLESLVGPHRAFVNMTRRVLVEEVYTLLPKDQVILELLETITGDDGVVRAVEAARAAGYLIALDDFEDGPQMARLTELAHIIKVDVRATTAAQRQALARRFVPKGVKLLAEKVETADEVKEAEDLGFSYFQGYFFCKPIMVEGRDLAPNKLHALQLLRLLNAPALDYDAIEATLRREMSLSVKLLRFLNSAAFGWKTRISSLRQALVLLGERPLRKWVALVGLAGVSADSTAELVTVGLVRARLCELVDEACGGVKGDSTPFLAGLLSVVDALVGRPLPEILREIAVTTELERALLAREGRTGRLLQLACAWEAADWQGVSVHCAELRLPEERLPAMCAAATSWAREVTSA